jgi:anti-sigma B factor antagonist
MQLTTVVIRGIDVIELHGKVVGDEKKSRVFHELVQSLLSKGSRKLVVSLGDAPWVNSLGIGMLISAYASVKHRGGEMYLAGATERTGSMFDVTHLFRVFNVLDTVDAAVDALVALPIANQPPAGLSDRKGPFTDNA